jgi:hypothetical protein
MLHITPKPPMLPITTIPTNAIFAHHPHLATGGRKGWRHHAANAVIDPTTGASQTYQQLLKGPDAALWSKGASNEIG